MEDVKTNTTSVLHYVTIAFIVLLACFALFFIDEDKPNNPNLFNLGNLTGLVIYFTPTFFISVLLFRYFSKKFNKSNSMSLSLLIGIPLSFLSVIFLLLSLFP